MRNLNKVINLCVMLPVGMAADWVKSSSGKAEIRVSHMLDPNTASFKHPQSEHVPSIIGQHETAC